MGRIATVAGRAITLAQLERRMADIRRGAGGRRLPPEGSGDAVRVRRWVVQELVTRALLAHVAGSGAEDGSPATIGPLFERVTAGARVPDPEIGDYYERNADLYRRPEVRTVSHGVFAGRGEAEALARRLADRRPEGLPPESRVELRRGELVGDVENAVFAADIGSIVGPIATEHGWHVLRVEEIRPEWIVPLAEVRDVIEVELLAAARARAFDEWLARRRRDLVAIEPAFEHPGHPIHGIPHHRH